MYYWRWRRYPRAAKFGKYEFVWAGLVSGDDDCDNRVGCGRLVAGTVCWECGVWGGLEEIEGADCCCECFISLPSLSLSFVSPNFCFVLVPRLIIYVSSSSQKDRNFYERIKRHRVDPSSQSYSNPVPDYYGEKIGSVKEFRNWMKDQRAYNKKRQNFL